MSDVVNVYTPYSVDSITPNDPSFNLWIILVFSVGGIILKDFNV